MIRTKIEKNFTFFFFYYMKIKSPSDHPLPPWKKFQELAWYLHHLKTCPICTLCRIRSHVHVRGLPTMAWDDDVHVPHASPLNAYSPPPFFEKFLDPRHDVVLVLHLNCGSNCQYMYRYMYMHPPPTPTKYRLFTIRKHAFLSLFLNDVCRSM